MHIIQIKNHKACKMTQTLKKRILMEMNNHNGKLPESRFRQIRLSGISQLSGSVPR